MLHIGNETVAIYYHCAATQGFFGVLHDFGDEQVINFVNLGPHLDTPQKIADAARAMSSKGGLVYALEAFQGVIRVIQGLIPNPEYVFECIRKDGEAFEDFAVRISECKYLSIMPTIPTDYVPQGFDASVN